MDFINTPEHIHTVINHLPIVGLLAAALTLLYALILFDTKTLALGFIFCILFGGSVVFVMETGEDAHERFEEPSLSVFIGQAGEDWIEEHEERAEWGSKAMYVTAALGLMGLVSIFVLSRLSRSIGMLALLLCLLSLAAAAWISDAGGRINHPEFRSAPELGPESGIGESGEGEGKHDDNHHEH